MFEQLTIFDLLKEHDPNKPITPPDWSKQKELFRKSKTIGEILEHIPKYIITFKKPVNGYKKKVAVYLGYWHTVDGYNLNKNEVLNIESWETYEWENKKEYRWK